MPYKCPECKGKGDVYCSIIQKDLPPELRKTLIQCTSCSGTGVKHQPKFQ